MKNIQDKREKFAQRITAKIEVQQNVKDTGKNAVVESMNDQVDRWTNLHNNSSIVTKGNEFKLFVQKNILKAKEK